MTNQSEQESTLTEGSVKAKSEASAAVIFLGSFMKLGTAVIIFAFGGFALFLISLVAAWVPVALLGIILAGATIETFFEFHDGAAMTKKKLRRRLNYLLGAIREEVHRRKSVSSKLEILKSEKAALVEENNILVLQIAKLEKKQKEKKKKTKI